MFLRNIEYQLETFAMQPEPLEQIMAYYLEDAKKYLQVIELHLLNLQTTIEDPGIVSELLGATRCGIVGAANLLPISRLHIASIHKIGFCLVDCFTVFQHERSLRVDQKLKDLLMQVFHTLKSLIEQLREPHSITDAQAKQVMSEIELIREALIDHISGLVKQSRSANSRDVSFLADADSADDMASLKDLELLIDELLGSSSI